MENLFRDLPVLFSNLPDWLTIESSPAKATNFLALENRSIFQLHPEYVDPMVPIQV